MIYYSLLHVLRRQSCPELTVAANPDWPGPPFEKDGSSSGASVRVGRTPIEYKSPIL